MKAARFDYIRPRTVQEVLDHLAEHGDEAKVIAGGQSLVPTMNVRLAAPAVLIDINHVEELSGIEADKGTLRIGALTRHAEIAASETVAAHAPLLSMAAPWIAHEAIRNRGTFGGSLATADPASEWPACATVLDATIHLVSARGTRQVAAGDFFQGVYETAIEPDELLTHVEIPAIGEGYRAGFSEFARRKGDYASVGVAVQGRVGASGAIGRLLKRGEGRLHDLRIAFFGVAARPMLATAAAAALEEQPLDESTLKAAQEALPTDFTPMEDLYMSSAAKAHLARVLLGRVMTTLYHGEGR
ncbi:xanthine dehydrogenase family protein subunit M [Ectothiorhodospiraceae bacterium WFHF3C12]|nr:xanthine dehydrogenase family protein subunit M [Ectothiorhodospiraceae bacterium WFHF3C12]